MSKFIRYLILLLSSIIFSITQAHATSYQIFGALNYSNPAALNSVKDYELIGGAANLDGTFNFKGTAVGENTSQSSHTSDILGYGRIAKRITPKIVIGLDITQPYYSDIQYQEDNPLFNLFTTSTIIRDINYSPKLSYQVNDRFAIGAGIDINNAYNAQINFDVPPNGNLTNKASSWAYGWDVGLFAVITRATFLNLSYYSPIVQHLSGVSTWGSIENNNFSADLKLPATYIANLIQMLSPRWALSGTIRYSVWNKTEYLVLQDTASGNLTIPLHYYNNVSTELATHYQINDKWAVLGALDYEPSIQHIDYMNPGLPAYTRYISAVGAEYEFIKGLKGKLVYAYVWQRAPIDLTIPPGVTMQGTERLHANSLDFSLSYDV